MALSDRMLVGVLMESGSYGNTPLSSSLPTTYLAVEACDITPDILVLESQDITNSYSGRKHETVPVGCDVSLTFKLTPRAGVNPSRPHWSPLLIAAGLAETLVDDTVDYYEYSPSSANNLTATPPASIVKYQVDDTDLTKARRMLARGVRGNLDFTFELEDFARATFTGRGLYFSWPSTETTVPAAGSNPEAYSGELSGMTTKNITITVAGQSVCLTSLGISTNWAINEDKCLSSGGTGTIDEVTLSRGPGERMGGSMTLKGRAATLNTLLPYIENATEFAVAVTLSNSDGDIYITMPAVQFGNYTMSADGGRISFDIPYFANGKWDTGEAGDNELVIAFGDGT